MNMPDLFRIKALIESTKAVIFDMDGVIIDSESVKFQAYQQVFLESFGVRLDQNDVQWRGRTEPEVMKYWLLKYGFKCSEISSLIERKRSLYRASIAQGRVSLIPGIFEFIGTQRLAGKRIGVATASNREDQEIIFSALGIGAYVDEVVVVEDVVFPKPAPDIYYKVARKLSLGSSECLVFEDSPSGVHAALAASMRVVVVLSSFMREDFDKSLPAIDNFLDLQQISTR